MKQPSNKDPFYTKTTYGGLSDCILGNEKKRQWEGSTLPNCVGCAVGCFNKFSSTARNKESWYWKYLNCSPMEKLIERAKKQGLKVGEIPKANSIIAWHDHVAYVEQVIDAETIQITESAWSGTYIWRTRNVKKGKGAWGRDNFLGFIYNPDSPDIAQPTKRDANRDQLEILSTNLRIRRDPSTTAYIYGYAKKGVYDFYETKTKDNHVWYRIGENQWVAYGESYMRIYKKTKMVRVKGFYYNESSSKHPSGYTNGTGELQEVVAEALHPFNVNGKWYDEASEYVNLPTIHKVEEGDTFKSLAVRYYGDSKKMNQVRIALRNNHKVTDKLVAGEELVIEK